jgi:AcrR family transcriptional regulator
MSKKAGRPSEKTDARERLIRHARELFTLIPYEKVSTRLIAQKADVNVAMIRYYFGSKAGLFETMVRETMQPVKVQMQQLARSGSADGMVELMRTYYQTMVQIPEFPRLIARIMNMSPSESQRKLLEKIFDEVSSPMLHLVSERLREDQVVRPDMDPRLCRVSFMSLMIFPFLAPQAMRSLHGISLDEAFLNQLLEHNIKLMSHGFMLPTGTTTSDAATEQYGENNETQP